MSSMRDMTNRTFDDSEYDYMASGLRVLTADMVEHAGSGHPGMPLGMADVMTVLFCDFLHFNPEDSTWPIRDRFILSAGHGCTLLYALLFLTGYKGWDIEDLKQFRRLHAKAAGHPEKNHALGIETTSGPLGQGIANAVGLSIASKILKEQAASLEYKVYAVAGDGCMMEGVSYEAMSLAGKLGLNNLIVLFDNNGISIDGDVSSTIYDDHVERLRAMGWYTRRINGHNHDEVYDALYAAQRSTKPTFIACKTRIAYGAPNKVGTAAAHGCPLGSNELSLLRNNLNWECEAFTFPQKFLTMWRHIHKKSTIKYENSIEVLNKLGLREKLCDEYATQYWNTVSTKLEALCKEKLVTTRPESTRKSSQGALSLLYEVMRDVTSDYNNVNDITGHTNTFPLLLGGSADLTSSTCAKVNLQHDINDPHNVDIIDFGGDYIHYGIREHAMAAIMNGLSLSCFIRPYGSTFLVFTDYCIPSIRLAAMMRLPVIFICTHDSIGVGEDGATHQPIEHLSHLRAMPNVNLYRPCDSIETAECWALALRTHDGPTILSLSRQDVMQIREDVRGESHTTKDVAIHILNCESVRKSREAYIPIPEECNGNFCAAGAYVLYRFSADKGGNMSEKCDVAIYSCGSEIGIAMEAAEKVAAIHGLSCTVISVPSSNLFMQQAMWYRERIMRIGNVRIVIEAGLKQSWAEFLEFDNYGNCTNFVGLNSYGASAPAHMLYKHYRITADKVLELITQKCNHKKSSSTTSKNMI